MYDVEKIIMEDVHSEFIPGLAIPVLPKLPLVKERILNFSFPVAD